METPDGDETLREDAANVKQAADDLLGDATAQVSEKAKELSGKAQQLYTDFADVLRVSTVERPFSALAIAAGVGFILGALHATSRRQPDYSRDRD
ncbi:CsbD family protein [Paraburkholderia sp. DHOC27]|uniref:CsbD family protein n=1 Tax=Paraburkholderia sp. DHOC27 TaxID=2303330 RepID=UPI000E3D995F|nr:CsbD family protein [Paraburkholderia sp. DHOC27]RFU48936.1 CsbD family protein [Paraburkholderia sp. DHOC27]